MNDSGYPQNAQRQALKVCDVCRQTFDVSDLDQVFHHDAEPHQPLDDEAAA